MVHPSGLVPGCGTDACPHRPSVTDEDTGSKGKAQMWILIPGLIHPPLTEVEKLLNLSDRQSLYL